MHVGIDAEERGGGGARGIPYLSGAVAIGSLRVSMQARSI
jgi:hypothetical protein